MRIVVSMILGMVLRRAMVTDEFFFEESRAGGYITLKYNDNERTLRWRFSHFVILLIALLQWEI